MPRPSAPSTPDAPTVRLPAATGEEPTTATGGEQATTAATPAPASDLSVNKIVATGGAAATSAVLGSYLGAFGTVGGAALGAVASTVASVVYQRSLERTRATVLSRIRPVPGAQAAPEQPPAPRQGSSAAPQEDGGTVVLRPDTPARRPRRVRAVLLGLLAFVLALGAITGIEALRGSTIGTGQTGTSVGRVVAPPPAEEEAPAEEEEAPADPAEEATPTAEPEDGGTDGATDGTGDSEGTDTTGSPADPGTDEDATDDGARSGGGDTGDEPGATQEAPAPEPAG